MRIRVYARTTEQGAENIHEDVEILDGDLAGLTEPERLAAIERRTREVAAKLIDWHWYEIDEDGRMV